MKNTAIALAAVLFCLPIAAKGFDPIPPEVWAMKEDPEHGVKGAVVLEQKVNFTGFGIDHLLRVRILSEAGRSAAEFRNFGQGSGSLEGRTSYRDGTSVKFDKVKDFRDKDLGDHGSRSRVLVAPGVTADCVLELKWFEDSNWYNTESQLPYYTHNSVTGKLGGTFKTILGEITLMSACNLSFQVEGTDLCPMDKHVVSGNQIYQFHNIPGTERPPYSELSLSNLPTYYVWSRPQQLPPPAKGLDAFWREFSEHYYRHSYEDDPKRGAAYKAFATEILAGLPEAPQARAIALLKRLDRRIRNTAYPTFEENAAMSHHQASETWYEHDLENAVANHRADPAGLTYLYFSLLRDAGIHPTLALVRSRSYSLFRYDLPDPHQLEHVIFCIGEKDKPLVWMDPTMRFAQPGLISSDYQGTQALFIDSDTWKVTRGAVGAQSEGFNVSRYDFQISVDEEVDHFQVRAGFSGMDEFWERQWLLPFEPAEQTRVLKERFEKGIAQCQVGDARAEGVLNPDQNVSWSLEASYEHSATGRYELDPFPGMGCPLALPEAWPERRDEPILMPRLLTWVARSRIHVPKGVQVPAIPAITLNNGFGSVGWNARAKALADGTQVEVILKVQVKRLFGPPETYPELEAFINTVKQVYQKKLVLEKS